MSVVQPNFNIIFKNMSKKEEWRKAYAKCLFAFIKLIKQIFRYCFIHSTFLTEKDFHGVESEERGGDDKG